MLITKYKPRRATVEEVRCYYLRYYCGVPDALFGSAWDKEAYLNAQTPAWVPRARIEAQQAGIQKALKAAA
ncbi:MAG: hypothetical protein HQ512_01665 [Rhodospirillales bacterium]|nr:hypothetical protein [Rhodospirillales bacterium]